MSGSRETGLWAWLSKAKKHYREDLEMHRVENTLAAGMPDVEGCLHSSQFFIELKSTSRPARLETLIRFAVRDREAQQDWIEKRWSMAENTWLLLQVGSGHKLARYLVPGCFAKEVYDGITEDRLRRMARNDQSDTAAQIVKLAAGRK